MKKIITEKDIRLAVLKVIKEEEGNEDSPQDVERFLDLADKYLFSRYGKIVNKIDTPKEKATLIAALADKWGVSPEDLTKVRSMLNTESIDEGYDSPEVMAKHAGGMMGQLRDSISVMTQAIEILAKGIESGSPKENLSIALNEVYGLCDNIITILKKLKPEIHINELKSETDVFIMVMEKFKRRVKILSSMSGEYNDSDYRDELERFIVKLTTALMRYGKKLMDTDKMLYQKLSGKNRGEYGI